MTDIFAAQILTKRYHIVLPVQDEFRKVLDELRKSNGRCRAPAKSQQCDLMNLGLTTRVVCEHKLDEDEVWNKSITELTEILTGIAKYYCELKWKCGNKEMCNNSKPLGDRRDKMKTCSWAEDLAFRIEPRRGINGPPSLNLGNFNSRVNLFPSLQSSHGM